MLDPTVLVAIIGAISAVLVAAVSRKVGAHADAPKPRPLAGDDKNALTAVGAEVRELRREMERARDERNAIARDVSSMRSDLMTLLATLRSRRD